jgi:tetratricopeptide (TPR) repeat protein
MRNPQRAAGYLAFTALAAAVLAPPEAWGSGRMVLVVGATFAFLVLGLAGAVPARYLIGGVAAGLLLISHSLWLSEDSYRSVEFLGLAWAYYCLFGVFRYVREDIRYRTALVLILLASAVSLYGIYQYFWGFDRLYAIVEGSQAAEAVRIPILGRIASERVFSTFALPGTLWGFLILTVPLHFVFEVRGHRLRRAALAANLVLVVATAALTQSYGFILGLLVVLGGWVLTRTDLPSLRRAMIAFLAATPVVGILAGALFVARASDYNPVWLRLQNWLSAWEIFSAYPLGSGLNTYAVLYLQHQQPGANETQFAHNTPLQLASELGLPGIAAMAALAVYLSGQWPRLAGLGDVRRGLVLALMVWGVHNLMDINVYFGSIGAVGASLAGLLMWRGRSDEPRREAAPSKAALGAIGTLAAFALISSGVGFVSGELFFRARTELELGKVGDAAATLRTASKVNPFDSMILHEAGQVELELYHMTGDSRRLDASDDYFTRAIRLSPLKVGPRIGLALTLSSRGRVREALEELERAQALHPASTQASNIRRLMERRLAQSEHQAQVTP